MSSSQQQSSRPTKFENNISSSFANRNTTNSFDGSDFSNYRNRNRMDRNDRNERSSRGGGSSSYSMRQPEMGRGGGHSSQRNSMRPSQERERGSNYQQSAMNADYRDNRMDAQRGGSENRSYKTVRLLGWLIPGTFRLNFSFSSHRAQQGIPTNPTTPTISLKITRTITETIRIVGIRLIATNKTRKR